MGRPHILQTTGVDRLWTLRGTIAVPPAAIGITTRVAGRLEKLRLDHIEQSEHHLAWRQGFVAFVFYRDWELLGGIDSGEITVDEDRLTYCLRFSHVLLLCLTASIFAGLFVGSGPEATPADGLKWGLIAMAWLYGANYAVTIFQLRRFFHHTIDAAARAHGE